MLKALFHCHLAFDILFKNPKLLWFLCIWSLFLSSFDSYGIFFVFPVFWNVIMICPLCDLFLSFVLQTHPPVLGRYSWIISLITCSSVFSYYVDILPPKLIFPFSHIFSLVFPSPSLALHFRRFLQFLSSSASIELSLEFLFLYF